jgi:hypothetical protein
MAAPTNAVQKLQKILANGEPSTHGLLPRSKPELDSFGVSIVAEAAVGLCFRYRASR